MSLIRTFSRNKGDKFIVFALLMMVFTMVPLTTAGSASPDVLQYCERSHGYFATHLDCLCVAEKHSSGDEAPDEQNIEFYKSCVSRDKITEFIYNSRLGCHTSASFYGQIKNTIGDNSGYKEGEFCQCVSDGYFSAFSQAPTVRSAMINRFFQNAVMWCTSNL